MIRVLIVDDQSLIREGLSMMLSLYDWISITGEAANGIEAIDALEDKETDVILMDIRMPVMDGVEATKRIKEKYPRTKVIILTTFNEDEYILEALNNGADAYLLKDMSSEELVKAIESVYGGNVLLHSDVARRAVKLMNQKTDKSKLDKDIFNELTKKEKEIALLVRDGKSNKEIAGELFITEGTVKNHISNILDKLELRDRTQLALLIKEYYN